MNDLEKAKELKNETTFTSRKFGYHPTSIYCIRNLIFLMEDLDIMSLADYESIINVIEKIKMQGKIPEEEVENYQINDDRCEEILGLFT